MGLTDERVQTSGKPNKLKNKSKKIEVTSRYVELIRLSLRQIAE